MSDTGAETAVLHAVRELVDHSTAATVFGAPICHDGLIVVPVARVSGGAGAGTETGPEAGAGGTGGGLGVSAKPAGVYVIGDGAVHWRPAVDVNRVIMGGQIVAVVALLTIRAFLRRARCGGEPT